MGKMQFLEQFEVVSASLPDGGGGVLAHSVHRQDGGLGKGRRKKRAGRVGLMVLGEQDSAIGREAGKFVAYGLSQIELLAQPGGQRAQERCQTQGRNGQRRLQQPRELQNRFVIKYDRIEVRLAQVGVVEAEADCVQRKSFVVFSASEPFLLRSGDDFAVAQQDGGGIVVVSGNAQDETHDWTSNEWIHERRQNRGAAENEHQRQQQKDDNQGNQPPFLFLLQKEQEFFAKLPHDAAEFIAALMAWQRQSRRQKANSLFKNVSFAA